MGFFDLFKRPSFSDGDLKEILTNYDVVDVMGGTNPFLIVSERAPMQLREAAATPDSRELGSTAPTGFIAFNKREYNSDLRDGLGLAHYDKMRRSDATCRATLRLVKTPVLAARWFIEPASESTRDKNVADFVWDCLTDQMSISFTQMLTESLLCLDYGYYMFEKVWTERRIDGKDRLVWQKLAPRHPMDVIKWKYDRTGGPEYVEMQPAWNPDFSNLSYKEVKIPIEKLLVFTFDREAGDLEGISVLRSAYKHWYYKEQLYKIDAIQKERHGIGVPVIKLPVNFTQADKIAAEALGRNLRTNERAHVVLPPQWELEFAQIHGQPVDVMKSIEHHDDMIRQNVLASFLDNKVATKEEDQTMFLKATRFIADVVCETFNNYAIPQLVNYNFERVGIPKLKARRIGEQQDWRTLSFAIRNLIGSGVIRPDDRLEAFIRDEMDLPRADVETVRITQTPQAAPIDPATLPNSKPGGPVVPDSSQGGGAGLIKQRGMNVGLPRQALPSANPIAPNAGIDKSGTR